jgi:hypothetical protein
LPSPQFEARPLPLLLPLSLLPHQPSLPAALPTPLLALPCLQLRAALEEPGGKLPGFMRMCDCVVRTTEEGGSSSSSASGGGEGPQQQQQQQQAPGKARFGGMVMEKLNGGCRYVFRGALQGQVFGGWQQLPAPAWRYSPRQQHIVSHIRTQPPATP